MHQFRGKGWLSAGLVICTGAVTVAVTPATGSAAPSPARAPAAAPVPADFTEAVTAAAKAALPAAAVTVGADSSYPSAYDEKVPVVVSTAILRLSQVSTVTVVRQVGAQVILTGATARRVGFESSAAPTPMPLARPGAGAVTGYVSTNDEEGPRRHSSVSWTERPGVNFIVLGRGEADRGVLTAVIGALPADKSQPSRQALDAMRTGTLPAEPAGPPSVAGGSRAYVDSTGNPEWATDDWGNESTQCTTCAYRFGNYTLMWQAILYVDLSHEEYPFSELDCDFGGRTATATAVWQSRWGSPPHDGVVGPGTHAIADNWLYLLGPQASGDLVAYNGVYAFPHIGPITFHRWGGNHTAPYLYDMKLSHKYAGQDGVPIDEWHGLRYSSANFSYC